jgi:hypothetical protein
MLALTVMSPAWSGASSSDSAAVNQLNQLWQA